MHEVPIDLAKATTMAPSVDDGSAGWTTPGRVPEAAAGMQVASPDGELLVFTPDGWISSPEWFVGCIPVDAAIFDELKRATK